MNYRDCNTPLNDLTSEILRSVTNYDPEKGIFTWKVAPKHSRIRVGDVAGCSDSKGYIVIKILYKMYKAHRLAWLYTQGQWPIGQVDHINRVKSDNRIANLREATNVLNGQNRSKNCDNTSGHTGVCWVKGSSKWKAYITINQKRVNLGHFSTIEGAVSARKTGEQRYWSTADTGAV